MTISWPNNFLFGTIFVLIGQNIVPWVRDKMYYTQESVTHFKMDPLQPTIDKIASIKYDFLKVVVTFSY